MSPDLYLVLATAGKFLAIHWPAFAAWLVVVALIQSNRPRR